MDSNNIVIQEEQLEDFISQAEMVIEEAYDFEEEPDNASEASAEPLSRNTVMANAKVQISDMLANKTFAPKNITEIGRLFDIFVFADFESQFLSILENCETNVLAQNPEEAMENRVNIGFMKAHTKGFSEQALQDVVKIIESVPLEQQDPYAWYRLGDLAGDNKYFELQRLAIEKNAQILKLKQDDSYTISQLDEVQTALSIAKSFQLEKKDAECNTYINKAFEHLQSYLKSDDADFDQAMHLCEFIAEVNHDKTEELVELIKSHIPKNYTKAHQCSVNVRMARLLAQAYYQQGNLQKAIDTGLQGYYGITEDYDEPDITGLLIQWLYEANRMDELLFILFESVQRDNFESEQTIKFIKKLMAEGHTHPELPLALAWKALGTIPEDDYDEDSDENDEDEDEDEPFFDDLDDIDEDDYPWLENKTAVDFIKQQIEIAKPLIKTEKHQAYVDLTEGLWLAEQKTKENYAKALPLIEDSIFKCLEIVDMKVTESLLVCRIFAYGVEEAFNKPFVPIAAASWNYNFGTTLDYEEGIAHKCKEIGKIPQHLFDDLALKYYQAGKERFEAFFETGQGRFRDGDRHIYSMLCNNYSIGLRNKKDADYQHCIEIHKQGIAVSPFAEHYDGIADCFDDMDDDEAFIKASEDLWRFSQEHGYSRYNVPLDIQKVSEAYNRLDRNKEIEIWIPRLENWWQALYEEEQPEYKNNYIDAMACCLGQLSYDKPEDAMVRLEKYIPEITELGLVDANKYAGLAYFYTKDYKKSHFHYSKALNNINSDKAYEVNQTAYLKRMVKKTAKKLKPWWQFW